MSFLTSGASNFKRAVDTWPDAQNLTAAYQALETCYENDSYGLVEHIKSFIEGVCVTIIEEFGNDPARIRMLVTARMVEKKLMERKK